MRCMNENCGKDPLDSLNKVVFNIDGDFCCDQQCLQAARAQMDHFCRVTLNNDRQFADWMGVDVALCKSEEPGK